MNNESWGWESCCQEKIKPKKQPETTISLQGVEFDIKNQIDLSFLEGFTLDDDPFTCKVDMPIFLKDTKNL